MPEDTGVRASAQPDDNVLLDRILAGDKQAFGTLVRRHEKRVYRTTIAITGEAADAEEAMQETFLKAYLKLRSFRRDSRFTTWLTRIAVNEALQIRRRRRETASLDDPGVVEKDFRPRHTEEWYANPEQRYAAQERKEIVESAIGALAPPYRVVFLLRDVEGLSTEETAEALGLTIAATKSRLLRARLMVREELAAKFARPATLGSRVRRARATVRNMMAMALERAVGRSAER